MTMKKIIVAILMMMIEQAAGWVHVTAVSNLYGRSLCGRHCCPHSEESPSSSSSSPPSPPSSSLLMQYYFTALFCCPYWEDKPSPGVISLFTTITMIFTFTLTSTNTTIIISKISEHWSVSPCNPNPQISTAKIRCKDMLFCTWWKISAYHHHHHHHHNHHIII